MNLPVTARISCCLIAGLLLAACGDSSQQPEPKLSEEAPSSLEAHRDFGDYRIHFNALNTDSLAPQVAKAYGIVRSKSRGMLNVSLIRKAEQGIGQAVKGKVSVNAANLTGQLKVVKLREIVEGEGENAAIYYIGEFPVTDGETLIFDLAVTPAGEKVSYKIRFQKQFFTG